MTLDAQAPAPLTVIPESTKASIRFNVMPDRPVSETLTLREYRVGGLYGEAVFDREYESSMLRSPDHFIFLTGLVHTQKLLYVILCDHFGIAYDPHDDEQLKIWPTCIGIDMPGLIRHSTGLVQKLDIESIEPREDTEGYELHAWTTFDDVIRMKFTAVVFRNDAKS